MSGGDENDGPGDSQAGAPGRRRVSRPPIRPRRSDDRFAMELFRRAVVERDEDAWRAIHDAYLPLVAGWIGRHPGLARCGEDSAYLANRAFERFWWALRPS